MSKSRCGGATGAVHSLEGKMPKLFFTDTNIADFLPEAPKTEAWFWDTQEAGLGLRVRIGTTETTRTWILGYSIGGKDRRDAFGAFSEFKLAEARNYVHKRRRDLQDVEGYDPRAAKQRAEEKATSNKTLREVIDLFFAKGHVWRAKTEKAHERYLRGTVESEPYFKSLLDKFIRDITRAQIATRLDEITSENSKHVAKQARTSLMMVYDFACARGFLDNTDVITGTDDPSPKKGQTPRQRKLTDAELSQVWKAAPALVRLLILTGCRRDEVGYMLWSELDLDKGLWTLPPERIKVPDVVDGVPQPRLIPLSAMAVAILRTIERGDRVRVFNSPAWSRIQATLPAFDKRWTFHDLRRTMRSGLSHLEISDEIAEACIGHKRELLIRTYTVDERLNRQRAAFNRWAAHVEALVSERPIADISPIRAA